MYMREGSGNVRDLHILILGFATPMHLTLKQLYKQQENEKKRKYASRILEVEQGTFTTLVFSTTGGMGEECARYHARLAELLAIRKGETYSTTVSWIRAKVSFALLRGALLCLRGSRGNRKLETNIHERF